PLYRKLPKRGFNNFRFAKKYSVINVQSLNKFNDGEVVDCAALLAMGAINNVFDGVKVLGEGELTKKLTVKAAVFSASAKEKIEAAGGKTEVV
ncbi:MAG: 50S ribosomal protein L15, partial [Clostridia bacterium]|nr:50S ribosomal protein L15 [Clostridia bacterium]